MPLNQVISSFSNLPFPESAGKKIAFGNLLGGSQALLLANLAMQSPGLLLVITPDPETASKLERELQFFLNNPKGDSKVALEMHAKVDSKTDSEFDLQSAIPVLTFPDWETLPF